MILARKCWQGILLKSGQKGWKGGTESEAVFRERVTSSFGNTISKFGSSRSARSQIRTQNLALCGADRCVVRGGSVRCFRKTRATYYRVLNRSRRVQSLYI